MGQIGKRYHCNVAGFLLSGRVRVYEKRIGCCSPQELAVSNGSCGCLDFSFFLPLVTLLSGSRIEGFFCILHFGLQQVFNLMS